jgi:hypothetical protein
MVPMKAFQDLFILAIIAASLSLAFGYVWGKMK